MRACVATILLTELATALPSATSHFTVRQDNLDIWRVASCNFFGSRPKMITLALALAKAFATAKPIPLASPVITTTWFLNSWLSDITVIQIDDYSKITSEP